jgi:hypothetical protein
MGKKEDKRDRSFRTEIKRLIGEVENNIVAGPVLWTEVNFGCTRQQTNPENKMGSRMHR